MVLTPRLRKDSVQVVDKTLQSGEIAPRFAWELRTARAPETLDDLRTILLRHRAVPASEQGSFLSPAYESSLHDPLLLPQCGAAVLRVQEALRRREVIAIFGDYDVDGVTSAALLAEALERLGGNVRVELPHREEGYGLSLPAVQRLVPAAQLLITVDNGTSAIEPVSAAIARGADVIIFDHHAVTGALPAGALIVNPALPSSRYPAPWPCAVGVAWKFVTALYAAEGRAGEETLLLDLVTLGTLADGVSLRGENRALVRWGLEVLRRTKRPGLRALAERAGMSLRDVTADAVTFRLVPRLNAAGRLRHANLALELLRTVEEDNAYRLAAAVDAVNGERKQLTESILTELEATLPDPLPAVVFVAGPWPVGMLGVLANRLAEECQRPAVAVAVRDDECVASIRGAPGKGSDPDAPTMIDLVREAESLLTRFGGHAGAAGFSFPRKALDEVAAVFRDRVSLASGASQRALTLECPLPFHLVTSELLALLASFEPFGNGNERPRFLFPGLTVAEQRPIGAGGDHLRFVFRHPSHTLPGSGVAFRWGNRRRPVLGCLVDVAAEVREDTFRGIPRLDLHVQDLRLAHGR